MEIEQVDSAAWTDMKKAGKVTCGIGNWYVDYNDPDSMLYPMSDGRTDLSSSFFHNDEFKQLMIECNSDGRYCKETGNLRKSRSHPDT